MLIETEGAKEWLNILKSKYKLEHTRLTKTDNAFTVFLHESITGYNNNIIVGRYCKVTRKGVVMDRRSKERSG